MGGNLKTAIVKTCMYMQFDRPHYHLYSIFKKRITFSCHFSFSTTFLFML